MTELKTESTAAEPIKIPTPSICRAVVYTDPDGHDHAGVVLEHKGLGVVQINDQTLLRVAADVPYNEQPLPHTWRYPQQERGLLVVADGVVVGVAPTAKVGPAKVAAALAGAKVAEEAGAFTRAHIGDEDSDAAEDEEDDELAEQDERAEGLISMLQKGYRESWGFTIVRSTALQLDGTVVRSCRIEIVPPGRAPCCCWCSPTSATKCSPPGTLPGWCRRCS